MTKATKIVATISDKKCDVNFIQQLYKEGMNVVRMNSAHIDKKGLLKIVNNVRAVSKHIALLIDTKGPEVRTSITEDEQITIKSGDKIKIKGDPNKITKAGEIYVSYPHFVRDLHIGDDILIDDGEIELIVKSKDKEFLYCEALNDGTLGSRKSVNVPGVRINLPSLTKRDMEFISYAIEYDLDFIAHSFVRNKQDIIDIQEILDKNNSPINIISKIENQEGVDNIDEILDYSYGIMIARGDLAIEVGQEKIPGIQRRLIRKCVQAKKPVIVATQMLHSMINHPRPTRAEVTDIANAIYYRTDALMLSGETANGKYPVEAVRTMAAIAREAEKTKLIENDIPIEISKHDLTSFLSNAAVETSSKLGTKAIITDTYSGKTARFIAAYRGTIPVLAICYNQRTTRQLALSYGVNPLYQKGNGNNQQYFIGALKDMLKWGWVKKNDLVCYLSSSFGEGYGTTFLEVNTVKKVLDSNSNYLLPSFD